MLAILDFTITLVEKLFRGMLVIYVDNQATLRNQLALCLKSISICNDKLTVLVLDRVAEYSDKWGSKTTDMLAREGIYQNFYRFLDGIRNT